MALFLLRDAADACGNTVLRGEESMLLLMAPGPSETMQHGPRSQSAI
jgi:hypothetical protein